MALLSTRSAVVLARRWMSTAHPPTRVTIDGSDVVTPVDEILHGHASLDQEVAHQLPRVSFGGGRSSVSGIFATVFGASGFTGNAVVNRLGKVGSSMILPYRAEPTNMRHLKPLGDLGQIAFQPCDVFNEDDLRQAMKHSNVVINLIGRNFSTRNFHCDRPNFEAAAKISKVAAELGVERLIHVSLLGASKGSKSDFSRSKALGEEAVRKYFPEATILRPASIYGPGDNLATKWANIIRFHWAFPYIAPGHKFQPMHLADFASAVMATLKDPKTAGQTYELGGDQIITVKEFLELLSHYQQVPLDHGLNLPAPLTHFIVKNWYRRFRLPAFSPEEVTWLEETDALVSKNALTFRDLGIVPSRLEDHMAQLLVVYGDFKTRFVV